MQFKRITPDEYAALFKSVSHTFNSVEFSQLNRSKCDDVHYLAFADDKGKIRLGIILGERGGLLRSPFSAPFGGMEERGPQRLSYYLDAAVELKAYGRACGKPVVVTLPPACYDSGCSRFSRQALCLLSGGGRQLYADFNYHYSLSDFSLFDERLWASARRNLSASVCRGLEFECCVDPTDAEIEEIYSIIRANHESHGYPVHMTLDDIVATSKIISMDFFIVRKEGKGIASAIIYHTSPETVQLIYWGDLPEGRDSRPMNFLSYNIIRHYAESIPASGVRFFDLGPASSDGIPAVGLCDFKESIGCRLTPKITIEI